MPGSEPTPPTPPTRCSLLRRRLVLRRRSKLTVNLIRYVLMVPVLLGVVLALLLQAGAAGWLVLPALSRSLGVDVSAEYVTINGSGRVVLTGVTMRARDLAGPGADLARIKRVEVDVAWASPLTGRSVVKRLLLDEPHLIVSMHSQSGAVNVAAVRVPKSGASDAPVRLPTLEVKSGIIDWCEHTEDSFTVMRRLAVEGQLTPDPEQSASGYVLDLRETASRPGSVSTLPLHLTGRINDEIGVEVTLNGLSFQEWLPGAVPRRSRAAVEGLALQGDVTGITARIPRGPDAKTTAEATLSGVRMTIPQLRDANAGAALTLRETSGTLRIQGGTLYADVQGQAEDVPYRVGLTYDYADPQGGYEVDVSIDDFLLARNPDFAPFLPDDVGEILAMFAASDGPGGSGAISPTAVVNSRIRLQGRYAPAGGVQSPPTITGALEFGNGASAFHGFPYPFADMAGAVTFTENSIEIRSITGRSASGATLLATGTIEPLGEQAGIDLEISVKDAPIDRLLEASMPPERAPILDELFNRPMYQALEEQGLVVSAAGAAELVRLRTEFTERDDLYDPARLAVLDAIDRWMERPLFEPGGRLDLVIDLHRPVGLNTKWRNGIRLRIEEAELVLRAFPLPILGRDIVVDISQDAAAMLAGSYQPLNALTAGLSGWADLSGGSFRPDFSLRADSVRIDELLRFAIAPPGGAQAGGGQEGRRTALQIIDRLGMDGVFDVRGDVGGDGNGGLGFELHFDPSRVTLTPEVLAGVPPLILAEPTGVFTLTNRGLELDARCVALGVDDDASAEDPSLVHAVAGAQWGGDGDPVSLSGTVTVQGLHASVPNEQLIAVFSPETAANVAELRRAVQPMGRADVTASLHGDGLGPVQSRAEFSGLRGVSFALLRGRLGLESAQGRIAVAAGRGEPVVQVEGFRADVLHNGMPAGLLSGSGTLSLAPEGSAHPHELRASLTGGRFESSLARAFVIDVIRTAFADEYIEHEARGLFDLDLTLRPWPTDEQRGRPSEGAGRMAVIESELRPRSLALTRRGTEVRFDDLSGSLRGSPGRLELVDLRGSNSALAWTARGTMAQDGLGGSALHAWFDAKAQGLSDVLRAMLPEEVNAQIDGLSLACEGPLELSHGRLSVQSEPPGGGPPRSTQSFEADLWAQAASLAVGVPVDQITGRASIRAQREPDAPAASLSLSAVADRVRVSGVWLEDAKVRVDGNGAERGRLAVPHLSGRAAGGQVTGHAAVYPSEAWAGAGTLGYELDLRFGGLRLSSLLDQLEASKLGLPSAQDLAEMRRDTCASVEGAVQLAGIVGDDRSRRGRGSVTVQGGEVVRTPGVTRLVELANLQLPAGERLDLAQVQFVADGGLIGLEEITLESQSLEVLGFGTVGWPSKELDLRFRSRGVRRVPLLSALLDAIRNEVLTTVEITGTLDEPAWAIRPFGQTRRLLGRFVGADQTERSRRLAEMQERAESRQTARAEYRDLVRPAAPKRVTPQPAPLPVARSAQVGTTPTSSEPLHTGQQP